MIKAMIGLGILSIPYVFDAVGLIPGLLIIVAVQTIMICEHSAYDWKLIVQGASIRQGGRKNGTHQCGAYRTLDALLVAAWARKHWASSSVSVSD